jgi:hypothetical protein
MARPARVRPPLTPAQRERVAGWLPVVARTIRAAQRRHPWLRDEIESDAQWVLCLLAADVPDAGPALAVHAARQSIIRTLQRAGRHMLLAPDDGPAPRPRGAAAPARRAQPARGRPPLGRRPVDGLPPLPARPGATPCRGPSRRNRRSLIRTLALAPTPGGGAWPGVFRGAVDCSSWPDGAYAVYVFNTAIQQIIDGPLEAIIRNGDDAPYFAPGGGPKSWTLTPNP